MPQTIPSILDGYHGILFIYCKIVAPENWKYALNNPTEFVACFVAYCLFIAKLSPNEPLKTFLSLIDELFFFHNPWWGIKYLLTLPFKFFRETLDICSRFSYSWWFWWYDYFNLASALIRSSNFNSIFFDDWNQPFQFIEINHSN